MITDESKRSVFVSIVVDDLDAREDLSRSNRMAGYGVSEENVKVLLEFIKLPDRKLEIK